RPFSGLRLLLKSQKFRFSPEVSSFSGGFAFRQGFRLSPRISSSKGSAFRLFSGLGSIFCHSTSIEKSFFMSPFPTRTHTCGELRLCNVGERVVLCGWVQKLRTISADLYFLPLRDSYGTTQLVYRSSSDPEKSHLLKDELLKLSPESVICIEGIVVKRPVETINNVSPYF
ncbi:11580_t:CDS:2, partial [Gigaspora rosea]